MNKRLLQNSLIILGLGFGYYLIHTYSEKTDPRIFYQYKPTAELIVHGVKKDSVKSDDTRVDFRTLIGKPLVLNFWATWCAECKTEKKVLKAASVELERAGTQLIGVATFDDLESVRSSDALANGNYPMYVDEVGELAQFFDVRSVPQTIVLDENGIERLRVRTALTEEMITTLTASLEIPITDRVVVQQGSAKEFAVDTRVLPVISQLPKFELTNAKGKPFGSDQLKSKIWISNFIFTSCRSACPMLTREMRRLQAQLRPLSNIEFVSISIDPTRDTPKQLQNYKTEYGVDWNFLVGDLGSVRRFIRDGFKLPAADTALFHTNKFVLVDRDLQVRGYYSSGSAIDLKRLRDDVASLVRDKTGNTN